MSVPIPKLKTVLWHGLHRKCPKCGQGPVYKGFFRMNDACPACGMKFMHDQGDLWMYIIVVDRVLFIFPLIVMLYFKLYNPYSVWFVIFAVALVGSLFYTVPHRNAMCLGIDYWARHKWGDLAPKAPSAESPKSNDQE